MGRLVHTNPDSIPTSLYNIDKLLTRPRCAFLHINRASLYLLEAVLSRVGSEESERRGMLTGEWLLLQ